MERIANATPDITQENIDKIAEFFPDCMTEVLDENGNAERAIDFDALKGDLSDCVAEGTRERYQFTWPGKAEAKLEARKPCTKTMRPCPEESVNWDTTENLYIEGDNLEALKIMRETYAGKINLIYIDPPYNSGRDYIYDDDYSQSQGDYAQNSGEYDDEGGRLVANPESNGRFHSDWCSMMYPRLLLARDLLSSDGIMYISIDPREAASLGKLLDEIFHKNDQIGFLTWESTTQPTNAGIAKFGVQQKCEYIYLVCKGRKTFCLEGEDANFNYPHEGKFGKCRFTIIEKSDAGDYKRETMKFKILGQDPRPGKRWQIGEDTARELEAKGRFEIVDGIVKLAIYPEDEEGQVTVSPFWTHFSARKFGTAQSGKRELNELMGEELGFDTVKPVGLICELIKKVEDDALVVDFFSGSATTAHAVMQQNKEDGGSRRFVMVQYPEESPGTYSTIAEMGKERIRRAGAKIAAEIEEDNKQLKLGEEPKGIPDIGFRILRIDSSNFRETYFEPGELDQTKLDLYIDNLKEDRTAEDLLFQVLPAFRIPYSAKIETFEAAGKTVYDVNEGQLLACFDEGVKIDTIEEIAKRKPVYAVLRDASLKDDATSANFEELFKTYSPDTIRRVI